MCNTLYFHILDRDMWLNNIHRMYCCFFTATVFTPTPCFATLYVRCLLFVVCCVGSGLCDGLITLTEEFYRVCVSVCDLETSTVRRPRTDLGCRTTKKSTTLYKSCLFFELLYNSTCSFSEFSEHIKIKTSCSFSFIFFWEL